MRLAKLIICFEVGAGAIAAQHQTTAGGPEERFAKLSWSKPTIRMDHDVVKAGDKIRLLIDRTNVSGQPILVGEDLKNRRTADLGYCVQVRSEKGELAPEAKWGRRVRTGKPEPGEAETVQVGSFHDRYVQPGSTYSDAIELDGLYEFNRPGKYTVQIVNVDEKGKVIFESNKIAFTVTKQEP